MKRYKIIALDIDGTLLNSCGRVPDRTNKTIHRAAEEGLVILVVTGRRFFTAKQRVLQLELPNTLLAVHNGAILKQLSGELLYHRLLPRDTAQQAVEVSKEMGLCPVVFAGTDDEATVLVEGNCLVQFVRVAKSVQHWAQLLATEDSTHQYDEYKGTTVHCSYCRIGG